MCIVRLSIKASKRHRADVVEFPYKPSCATEEKQSPFVETATKNIDKTVHNRSLGSGEALQQLTCGTKSA